MKVCIGNIQQFLKMYWALNFGRYSENNEKKTKTSVCRLRKFLLVESIFLIFRMLPKESRNPGFQ